MAEAQETFAGATPRKGRRDGHFSKDGKWKSFPKVPNLLQCVSTGTYFARAKLNGKLIRQSLETTVYTTAREPLPDFLKRQKSAPVLVGTFGESLSRYRADLDLDVALSSATKLIVIFKPRRQSSDICMTQNDIENLIADYSGFANNTGHRYRNVQSTLLVDKRNN